MRFTLPSLLILGLTISGADASAPKATPTPKPKLLKAIPNQTISTSETNGVTINLTQHFSAPPAPGDIVFVTTSLGNFYMQLFPSNAPATVANFLAYATNGAYENSLIYASIPGTIIEMGAYSADGSFTPTPNFPPITNEAGIPNTTGTAAMALSPGDPNSATSEWFINETNNTFLDTQDEGNGPYTVFAQVLGDGMAVVDDIGALTTDNFTLPPMSLTNDADLTSVPLRYWFGGPVNLYNLVAITHVITLPYFAVSSDPTAFSTEIQGTNLIVKFLSYGTSDVTITTYATDTNGNSVHSTFAVAPFPKGSQTITFPAAPPQQYTTNPYTFEDYTNYPYSSSGIEPSVTIKSGPAKVAHDQLYFTGVGTITLVAHQPGNANYNAAANVTGSVIVVKADQTINFPQISAPTNIKKFPFSFTLTNLPTASSGLAVKIVASPPAKLSGKKLTLSGAGTIILTASQAGNANYNPAPSVTNSFLVSLVSTNQTNTPAASNSSDSGADAGGIIAIGNGGTINFGVTNTYTGGTTVNSGSLTLNGSGTTTLSGSNSLISSTTVTSGTLSLAPGSTLSGSLDVSGGTINLGGGTLTILSSMTGGGIQNGTITNSGAYTLQGGTINANLEGTNGLTMDGASNTLILSGDNSYTGGTTIAEGTLTLSGTNGLPAPTTIGSNAALILGPAIPNQQLAFASNGLITLTPQTLSLLGLSTNADYSNVTNTATTGSITLTNGGMVSFEFSTNSILTTPNGNFTYTNGFWSATNGTYSFTNATWIYLPASD